MERQRKLSVSIAVAAGLLSVRSALGLTFNFTPAEGMSQSAIDGFTEAGQRWSSVLSDNVTVNININFTTLGAGILGSASSNATTYTYANTRTALINDAVSADDATATSNLQDSSTMSFLINLTSNNPNGSGSITPYLDAGTGTNNTFVRMNHANAKATGQRGANNASSDASITFSDAFTWDFDPKDGISPGGAFDFVGVATHEIGHALGFVSGVDVLDINAGANESTLVHVKPMDFFRYSADSISNGDGIFDWTADTRTKYFSIDGGETSLTTFSTGVVHGDGRQASHWKDNLGIGIMDPTFGSGEIGLISAFDRQMMDVIGWQLNNTWTWIDPLGGNFNNGVRWSSTAVPQVGQDAIWNLNNTYALAFTGAQATNSATIRAGTVTYSLGGFTYNVANALNIAPTAGDVATLQTTGGTLAALSVAIGGNASVSGGTGILSVDGGDLIVTNALRIWSGGTLKYNGGNVSAGNITLDGGTILTGVSVNTATPISTTGGTIDTNGFDSTFSGAITGTGTLSKASAGTLHVTNVRTTGLNVTGGTLSVLPDGQADGVSKLTTLVVSPAAKLDLTDNKLITTDPAGTQSGGIYSDVQGLVQSGRNGGTWDGDGIITSQSDALGTLTTIGVSTGALALFLGPTDTTIWAGQTIDANSTLAMYTYTGDSNLDGLIDGTDYFYIDNSVGTSADGYGNGDFNYDGIVDGTDYFFIDSNIVDQGAPFFAGSGAELLASIAAVPEPTSAAIFTAFLLGSLNLHRRRRKK